jgi:chromosome segregation ATPase
MSIARAAQELEWKRQTLEHARAHVKVAETALTEARATARRANEALASAEQELVNAKGSVIFAEQRMASAGADLLSALKEANLMPDPNRPTVGKEPDHDHAKS